MRVGIAEAKTRLSQLVMRAEAGEEVVITRAGRPAVRLVREPEKRPLREFVGSLGDVRMAEDFNALDEQLQRDFGMLEGE